MSLEQNPKYDNVSFHSSFFARKGAEQMEKNQEEGEKEVVFPTMANKRLAESEGCAPTPSQYWALTISSLMSLNGLRSPQ